MAKRKLQMPKGTDEVNYGTTSYPVERDGTVEVSDEAAGPLLHEGGAIEIVEVVDVVEEGMARIYGDPGCAISQYVIGEDGYVDVPSHLALIAVESHGFRSHP
jgi:hypothetical protein